MADQKKNPIECPDWNAGCIYGCQLPRKYDNPDPSCHHPRTPECEAINYCWTFAHHVDGTLGYENLEERCKTCEFKIMPGQARRYSVVVQRCMKCPVVFLATKNCRGHGPNDGWFCVHPDVPKFPESKICESGTDQELALVPIPAWCPLPPEPEGT